MSRDARSLVATLATSLATSLAISLSAVLLSSRASADDAELIRVVVRAPASCVDPPAFAREITGRTARARVVDVGEARTFTVELTQAGSRVKGTLTISSPNDPPATRDVAGVACDEVASALGLIAALAIDPHASASPTLPPPPPPPPSRPRSLPPMPPPRVFDRTPWWGPIGLPLPVIPSSWSEPRWRPGWGLSVGGMSAVAPAISLSVAGFLEIERAGGGVYSPSFRAAFVDVDSGIRAANSGHNARFTLLAGRLEGCPVRLEIVSWLAALPCVRLDAGQLTGSGFATVSLTSSRPWVAPGTGARLEAEIAGRLRLEVEAGVNIPLVRDTFSFGPPGTGQVVQTVPPAGGTIAAGVGSHFP